MKNGKLYASLISTLGTFVYDPYPPVEGNPFATIRVLCDIEDKRYYFVDQGVPCPQSPDDEFVEVTSQEEIAKLRNYIIAIKSGMGLEYLPTNLDELRITQQNLIREGYEAYALQPVTTPEGLFDGGFDSAIKLDAAMRLNQAAGLESVTFFDSDNQEHILTFDNALVVVVMVAGSFQKALAQKQKLFKDVDECNNEDTMRTIVWSVPN